jgi:hypothetical protein
LDADNVRRLMLTAAMLATATVAAPAGSQESLARPQGYLFGQPHLLTQQLIWGLAHGVKLLATACRDAEGGPVAEAYGVWFERQRQRIEAASRDLSQHYFGQDAATEEALTAALHLKPALQQRPDEITAACATFVQAIAGERYDLELFYRLRRDAARVERAEAVRARVAFCREQLLAEPAAALAARFSAWTLANETLESVSRSRLLDHAGAPLWQRDTGVGAQPPAVACGDLAAALDQPGYALADVFEEAAR